MIPLSEVAKMLNSPWDGADCNIRGFSTDSRAIQAGDLFIALKGERFNGHDYVSQAAAQGASAVMVSEKINVSIPQIQVKDTTQGLMILAHVWRKQFQPQVIAITGSCGKTSTRALVQAILSYCGPTLASERSFNNNIGVPLTLLRLRAEHRYAVIEIGANHPGEVASLVQIVQPTVAMITNAGPAHLEGFGSLEGVAHAKGEIYQTLSTQGAAIINRDDVFADYWQKITKHVPSITFGIENTADIMAQDIQFNAAGQACFILQTPNGSITVQLPLLGRHHVYNALAAAAATFALHLPLEKIKQGLENAVPEKRRLIEQKGINGATLIDDSYNANPSSVKAAIEVLAHRQGTRVLVLGDMLELGAVSHSLHREVGEAAKKAKIHHLFCYGPSSWHAVQAFGENAEHFATQQALVEALRPLLNEKMTILVKGSNSMGMNQVVLSLLQE